MSLRHPMCLYLLVGALFLSCHASSVRAQVSVTVNPFGGPTTTTFPPDMPPADLVESADTQGGVSLQIPKFNFTNNADGSVTITKIDVTVSGSTTIRLPTEADDDLKAHENGHHTLFKDEYDKNAKRKAQVAFNELIGKKFANQADANKALDAAIAKSAKAIGSQMFTLNSKYDDLTHHGDGTAKTTNEGIAMAKQERDNAKPAGQKAETPKNLGPKAQSSNFKSFLDSTDTLQFTANTPITNPTAPGDPINTRGLLVIQPLVRIGLQDNGTTLLSDGKLQIIDTLTGNELLHGYLFEAAIMPSSVPGYQEMIQAYLDIPPDFAGGINNFINSPLLAQIDAASAAGNPFEFWYFTPGSITATGGSTGDALIAVPVPEPATLLFLAGGMLLALHNSARPRRR